MATLVVGATGATGRLLVRQLLDRDQNVRVIVRVPDRLPENVLHHANLSLICASVLELSDREMAEAASGCSAVASCLGHNLTLKGIFGPPHRLVTNATRRLCAAIQSNPPAAPVRFVLMNTTGNRNRDIPERVPFADRAVLGLLRVVLPPQADNEQAADYLRTKIGKHNAMIEWVAVRPDSLIDQSDVSEYEVYPSPVRSAVFNAGKTSRVNVAHFMAELMTDDDLWTHWNGQMPVIYNKAARN